MTNEEVKPLIEAFGKDGILTKQDMKEHEAEGFRKVSVKVPRGYAKKITAVLRGPRSFTTGDAKFGNFKSNVGGGKG